MSYRKLLKKEYIFVYLIYFFVFFAIGSLDQQIPLFFDTVDSGAVIYGTFLSALSFANIVLPTVTALIAKRIGSKKTTIIYLALTVIISAFLFAASNEILMAVLFFMINISQIVFNFSLGSSICLSIENSDKGKFFAVRDVFLYGAVSIGLALSAIAVKHFSMKDIIAGYACIMLIPLVMLLVNKSNKFIRENEYEEVEGISLKGLRLAFKNKNFILMLIVSSLLTIYASVYAYVPFLASSVGLDYTSILNSFAFVTVINVIVALFLSGIADATNRKLFFVIDIASDLIPIVLFMMTTNTIIFIIALILTAVKDVFAPITFAYKYELFDEKDGQLFISLLESFTSIFTFILPVLIGILWDKYGKGLFALAFVSVLAAAIAAIFLPNSKK